MKNTRRILFSLMTLLIGFAMVAGSFVPASAKPVVCHVGDIDVKIGDCVPGSDGRDATISGVFNAGEGYRGTVAVDGVVKYGTETFSGDPADHAYTISDHYAFGTHTVVATLEKLVVHPDEVSYECPAIEWVYGAHSVTVPYDKSQDPHKCHRPSDSDLMKVYGMDHDEKQAFKDAHSEWMDAKTTIVKPGWSEWVATEKRTTFDIVPCPATATSTQPPTATFTSTAVIPTETPEGQKIEAKALCDHEIDGTVWHFIINGIKDGPAPDSIHVVWDNGASEDVNRLSLTPGGVAHYETANNLDANVVSATATIYAGWTGQFNLSHGPACVRIPTSTPTLPPTATGTLPPTATGTLPPTATGTLPPTATGTLPPTATGTLPPTSTSTATLPPTSTSTVVTTSTATPNGTVTRTPPAHDTGAGDAYESTSNPVPAARYVGFGLIALAIASWLLRK